MTGIDPGGSCAGVLRPGDVLLSLGGVRICSDGTAEPHDEPIASAAGEGGAAGGGRRGGRGRQQRVLFGHFANMATVGDLMALEVVREGQRLDLDLRCRCITLVCRGGGTSCDSPCLRVCVRRVCFCPHVC